MPTAPQQVETQTARFDSLYSYSESVLGEGFDFQQLDHGPSLCKLDYLLTDTSSIQRLSMSRRTRQRGAPLANSITFGLVLNSKGGMPWNNYCVDESTLLLFPAGKQFEGISPAGFVVYTVSIDLESSATLAEQLELNLAVDKIGMQVRALRLSPENVARLTWLMDCAVGKVNHQDYTRDEVLGRLLPSMLLSLQVSEATPVVPRKITGRSRALARATDYIEAHAHTALDLGRLPAESCISPRSLQRAFTEHYQMTPRDYLRTVRLNRARQRLEAASPEASILDVALDCGFSHQGKFSASYRQQFGELPSQTVKRQGVR